MEKVKISNESKPFLIPSGKKMKGYTKVKEKSLIEEREFLLETPIIDFIGSKNKVKRVSLHTSDFSNVDDKEDYIIIGFDTEYYKKDKSKDITLQSIKDTQDDNKEIVYDEWVKLKNTILLFFYSI